VILSGPDFQYLRSTESIAFIALSRLSSHRVCWVVDLVVLGDRFNGFLLFIGLLDSLSLSDLPTQVPLAFTGGRSFLDSESIASGDLKAQAIPQRVRFPSSPVQRHLLDSIAALL